MLTLLIFTFCEDFWYSSSFQNASHQACVRCFAVPGRNACEIRMVHQEDAGMNVEMAKMAFAKGIWSYVCKMDDALRKYSDRKRQQLSSAADARLTIQKVRAYFLLRWHQLSTRNTEDETVQCVVYFLPMIQTQFLLLASNNFSETEIHQMGLWHRGIMVKSTEYKDLNLKNGILIHPA